MACQGVLHVIALALFVVSAPAGAFRLRGTDHDLCQTRLDQELNRFYGEGRHQPPAWVKNFTTPLISVDSRIPKERLTLQGVPGLMVENAGYKTEWKGWSTKIVSFQEYLNKTNLPPDQIVMLTDYDDLTYGGCTEQQLLDAYHTTVKASGGAKVVVAGAPAIWPVGLDIKMDAWKQFDKRRHAVQAAFSMNDKSYAHYLKPHELCAPEDIGRKRKAAKETKTGETLVWDWRYLRPEPGNYQFVNAGLFMGPVAAVQKVLAGLWEQPLTKDEAGKPSFDDQGALTYYMFAHPDEVTVDYAGAVSLTNLGPRVLEVKDGLVYNPEAAGRVQCFVHTSGDCDPFSSDKR